nr:PREDICTED: uncharacterized protein LOC108207717 [Daucus carota subsp. sativus]
MSSENYQLWSVSGEFCPEGTVPFRRTTEKDVLRASSVRRFGRKFQRPVRKDTSSSGHEQGICNVAIEANSFIDEISKVSPELYGDIYPRFITYWTADAYHTTGCYNLLCSGFVQTNNRITMGAAISPSSSYQGGQYDISILVWKVLWSLDLTMLWYVGLVNIVWCLELGFGMDD